MAVKKKPARKRKAAKPVMAWVGIWDDGLIIGRLDWTRKDAQAYKKSCAAAKSVTVSRVEVRR